MAYKLCQYHYNENDADANPWPAVLADPMTECAMCKDIESAREFAMNLAAAVDAAKEHEAAHGKPTVTRSTGSFDRIYRFSFGVPVEVLVVDGVLHEMGLDQYRNGGYSSTLKPVTKGSLESSEWIFTHALSCN